MGVCGTAVMKEGCNTNLKYISSAAVRIGREKIGVADGVGKQLLAGDGFASTLILSPPGGGKTTLLRDLVRWLSYSGQRIALIDERGEVAVMHRGTAQMDVGPKTDVLDGCPKAVGIPVVLRAMNPQIIAVDEITAEADLRAMSQAAGCGVGLLATVHGESVEELQEKPLYRDLLARRVFSRAVRIERRGRERVYVLEELP